MTEERCRTRRRSPRIIPLAAMTPLLAACESQTLQPGVPVAKTVPMAALLGLWVLGVPTLSAWVTWFRRRARTDAPAVSRTRWANRAVFALLVIPAAVVHVALALTAMYDVAFGWTEPKYAWLGWADWVFVCVVGLTLTGTVVVLSILLAALSTARARAARMTGMILLGVSAAATVTFAPPLAVVLAAAALLVAVNERRGASRTEDSISGSSTQS